MKLMRILLFSLWQIMLPVSHAAEQSALDEGQTEKVEVLVKKLGDEDFSVRQQAAKELRAMGEAIADQLEKLSKHPDPEVRARIAGLLDDLAALRKELKWVDPKNLGKAEYYSATGRAVRLTFKNLTKKPVRIYWIETDGRKRAWRGLLKAGESAICERSYIGHVWLVTDADQKPLGLYKIDIVDPVISVREKDLKK